MNSDNIKLSLSLSISHVELYTIFDSTVKLATKGDLNILRANTYRSYILQINDFRYSLFETIPILAAKQDGNRFYVLPNTRGHYAVKITRRSNPDALDKLESIFKHNCCLAYKKEDDNKSSMQDEVVEIKQVDMQLEGRSSFGSKGSQDSSKGSSGKSNFTIRLLRHLLRRGKKSESKSAEKYIEAFQTESRVELTQNNVFGNEEEDEEVITMDKEYVQALIMSGKTFGEKYTRPHSDKKKKNNKEKIRVLRVSGGAAEFKNFPVEAYDNMTETLKIMSGYQNERNRVVPEQLMVY